MSHTEMPRRVTRAAIEVLFGFLAMHGALNLAGSTGASTTIRAYGLALAIGGLVVAIGTWRERGRIPRG